MTSDKRRGGGGLHNNCSGDGKTDDAPMHVRARRTHKHSGCIVHDAHGVAHVHKVSGAVVEEEPRGCGRDVGDVQVQIAVQVHVWTGKGRDVWPGMHTSVSPRPNCPPCSPATPQTARANTSDCIAYATDCCCVQAKHADPPPNTAEVAMDVESSTPRATATSPPTNTPLAEPSRSRLGPLHHTSRTTNAAADAAAHDHPTPRHHGVGLHSHDKQTPT
jgi:hypothetical protein